MSKKINILHLINSLEAGGAENLLLNQIKLFDKSKFNVHVGYLKGPLPLIKLDDHIKVSDFSNKEKFSFNCFNTIRKYIIANNIDILHTHLIHASIIGKIISFFTPNIINIATRHYALESKQYRFINKLDNYFLKYNDAIICISKYVKSYLINKGFDNQKLHVIYNGINIDKYKVARFDVNENIITTIGRIDKQKGIDTLIKSFSKFLEIFPKSKLNIIGEGPLKDEYIFLAKKLNIYDNINFTGLISSEEVIEHLRKTDLFVLASRWEGFGMVLIEANAIGIPVIATKVEAIPEIIKDGYNGFLISPNSPIEILEKMKELIESKDLRKDMGQNGIHNVLNKFSLDKMVTNTQNLYIEMINSNA